MKTEATSGQSRQILKEIADKLVAAHQEIDELAIQLALGKAEARDQYELIRKEFRSRIQELKQTLKPLDAKSDKLIVDLEVLLTTTLPVGSKALEEQVTSLLAALKVIGSRVTSSDYFHHEVEKFKLKLIILQLFITVKKFEIKDSFRDAMSVARSKVADITGKMKTKVNEGKATYNDFSDEIQLAYKHMRKAVEKL